MKRLSLDEEAVSEVLGTILTLLITVALFSTVFATVQQLEGPDEEINVELKAGFDDNGNITIDHLGGDPLDMERLTFFLTNGEVAEEDMRLLNEGEEDNIWGVSDTVLIEDYEVNGELEVIIRYDDTGRVLLQSMLIDGNRVVDIREARIDYEVDWRDHAEPGEEIKIKARVLAPIWKTSDSFDPAEMYVNASITESGVLLEDNNEISSDDEIPMKHTHNGKFVKGLNVSVAAENERHRVKIEADHPDMDLNIEPAYVFLNIGKEPADYYSKNLEIGNYWLTPRAPSNGETVEVEIEVFNEGERDYEAKWKVKDDRQPDLNLSGEKTITSGAAPTLISTEYEIEGHGAHELSFEIITDENDDWEGDTSNETMFVDPNILVVKDHLPTDSDEANIMKNSLSALNLVDHKITSAEEFENIEEDDKRIEKLEDEISEYSVTIWMLGNYTEGEEPYLTDADVLSSLDDYVEGNLEESPLNGTLWLVGSGIKHFEESGNDFGDLKSKIGFESEDLNDISSFEDNTLVNPEHDKNGTFGDFEYDVSSGEYSAIEALDGDVVESEDRLIFQHELDETYSEYLGVGYEADTDQRTAVNPFTFDSIHDPGQRAMITGEVVEWLSNITSRTGVDVAVTSQTIEPTAPMYMDEITIESTLRNNGPENVTVSVRAIRNRGEEILTPDGEDTVHLEKNGGTATVTFTWIAEELGKHEFLVTADYYNEIDEVNERNNDIRYKELEVTEDDTEVNVQFSTLLVDSDGSDYDGYHNVTGDIKESFDRLGYGSDIHYDYHTVGEDKDGPEYEDYMENYNAIFWVAGERTTDLFTENDIDNILDYLEQDKGANMLFMGEHILSDLSNTELRGYLGIDGYNGDENTNHLVGQENTVGHGLNYKIEEGSYPTFETNTNGDAILEDINGNKFASTYDDGSTKTIYMGVNINRINGTLAGEEDYEDWPMGEVNTSSKNAREELIYSTLWNFGKRDERSELRVSDYDIEFSSDNPQTGRSYQIKAEIENIGYTGASALVRVREGDNHIASQTAFIEGSERVSKQGSSYFEVSPGSTTIEVTWNPMEGGMRPIRVRVDPLRSVDEIEPYGEEGLDDKIMEFNNQAKVRHPVYYFYDDMEHGANKWSHDSTMMNIDGSSPLNFMSAAEAENTNVANDWNWTFSGSTDVDGNRYLGEGEGVYQTRDSEINEFTDNASYSPPRSYWMAEGVGDPERKGRKPLDIVLIFDMAQSNGALADAKQAGKAVVDMLQEGDRVSIFEFGEGTTSNRLLALPDGWTNTTEQKNDIKGIIDNIDTGSEQKALFDTMSYAVYDLDRYGRNKAVEGIISYTDGISSQDGSQGGEYKYAPGGGVGEEPDEPGPYQWYDDGDGLLGIPYNIMTISIADKVEPRQHWVSATSHGNHSYGVLEKDTSKLTSLFKTFVTNLMESARGGLRSVPDSEQPLDKDKTDQETLSSPKLQSSSAVKNTKFFVYSDAFSTGSSNFVPSYDPYDTFEFDHIETSGQQGLVHVSRRTYASSDTPGERISNTVKPRETLKELDGTYEEHGAYVNFLLYTEQQGQGTASLKLSVNGETVFTEMTDYTQNGNDYGSYHEVDISQYISGTEPFTFTFEHDGDNGQEVQLDDISFTYEIDYFPEDHEYKQEVGSNRTYRYMTTPSVEVGDVDELNSATLEFQNRYKTTEGTAGGFIYLWGKEEGKNDWTWKKDNRLYVEPDQSYTGNLNLARIDEQNEIGGPNITGDESEGDLRLEDCEGKLPYWVFNGKSADRTFDWSYTSVDVGKHEDFLEGHEKVRAVFMFAQLGGITREDGWTPDMGWYVDNVRFKVSSEWSRDGPSYWNLVSADELDDEMGITDVDTSQYLDRHGDEDGKYWMFASEENGEDVLPEGVDSSLYTHPIYLDNAENPKLSAYMKFNINDGAGKPPDGLRVEVSADDGKTWNSITYGARVAWNASGTDADSGQAYSGTTDEDSQTYGWVDSSTLYRLSADLSGWRGESILLRFRIFTNKTEMYDDPDLPKAIFIDDVVVAEGDMDIFDERGTSVQTTLSNSRETEDLSKDHNTLNGLDQASQYKSYIEEIIDFPNRTDPVFHTALNTVQISKFYANY